MRAFPQVFSLRKALAFCAVLLGFSPARNAPVHIRSSRRASGYSPALAATPRDYYHLRTRDAIRFLPTSMNGRHHAQFPERHASPHRRFHVLARRLFFLVEARHFVAMRPPLRVGLCRVLERFCRRRIL